METFPSAGFTMSFISHDTKTQPWQTSARRRVPTISVVATVTSVAVPAAWLSELARRCAQLGAELILVTAAHPHPGISRSDHAMTRVVFAEPTSSRLQLRALGIEAAMGDIVLFVHERELFDALAVDMIIRAGLGRGGLHKQRSREREFITSAVGGPSEVSTGPSLNGFIHQELRESAV
jgi:hypothetical protein